MQRIPVEISSLLEKNYSPSVFSFPISEVQKWVIYYWDYCIRYNQDKLTDEAVNTFVNKLIEKKQNSTSINHARESIRFFQNICAKPLKKFDAFMGTTWDDCYNRLAELISLKQYSKSTLDSYKLRIRQFEQYLKGKSPLDVTKSDAEKFLTYLTVDQNVSASTQNLAFNSLLFLFKNILKKDYSQLRHIPLPKKKLRIPTVLSKEEVAIILAGIPIKHKLFFSLLYGCGLRLNEALNLRIHNFNFSEWILSVQSGKGDKARTLPLPVLLKDDIMAHFEKLKARHKTDTSSGVGPVSLPKALSKKYVHAGKELAWQWFFPAETLYYDKENNFHCRYHIHDTAVQKVIKKVALQTGIPKRISAHTFRHSFATHLLQNNFDIRTIQELMGHSDVRTTMIYTHTIQSMTKKKLVSPLDLL